MMQTGSKILLIEDAKDDLVTSFFATCKNANYIDKDMYRRISDWSPTYDQYTDLCQKINEELPNIRVAGSFQKAVELILQAAQGEDYEWFFIDRDLSNYKDVNTTFKVGEKEFNKSFSDSFGEFLGDYFVVMLLNANVPIEKICFFTNNTDEDTLKTLRKSPYLHDNNIPDVIRKSNNSPALIEKLRHAHRSKIRFLYKDIFNNQKVNDIWGSYLELFIALLARRYSGKAYEPSQGIILRLMIEVGIPNTIPQRYADLSTRQFLNYNDVQYNISLKVDVDCRQASQDDKDLHNAWKDIVKNVGRNLLWASLQDVKNRIESYNLRNKTSIQPRELINYDTARFLTALSSLYFSPPPTDLPPKYIFSYIDNIYTVTSEFSAHGKNNLAEQKLSQDGWNALLSGMLQIMQWVANTNPNPPSP